MAASLRDSNMLRPRVGLCVPVTIEGIDSPASVMVKLLGQGRTIRICIPGVEVPTKKSDYKEALRVTKNLIESSRDPHVFIDHPHEILLAFGGDHKIVTAQIYLSRDKTLRGQLIAAGVVDESTR